MRKFLPVLLLVPALSGCGAVSALGPTLATNLAMGGATVVSYSVVGQSPVDYAISKYRGQDCDIRNPKKYDGLYCVNGKYEVADPQVYCYRSLGDADCSDRLDPYGNRNQPIVRGANGQPVAMTAAPAYSNDPVPAPASLAPAATEQVTRPASAPAAHSPANLTPADMALQGS